MFAFLNGVHNFANANNIFTKGMSSFVNFNPFDLQTKKENSKNNNKNTDDLVSQINSLKTQVEEIKKKTS